MNKNWVELDMYVETLAKEYGSNNEEYNIELAKRIAGILNYVLFEGTDNEMHVFTEGENYVIQT